MVMHSRYMYCNAITATSLHASHYHQLQLPVRLYSMARAR
jgi:hypothetical protein